MNKRSPFAFALSCLLLRDYISEISVIFVYALNGELIRVNDQ